MALALRPAVLFMLVASALFLIAGVLDGDAGWPSYVFGAINLVVAVLIARGSERVLALRIGLAAFFVLERLASAFALGPKSVESIAVHVLTSAIEAVILFSTLRVWRLGHSVTSQDLAFLTLSPAGAAAAMGGGPAVDVAPAPAAKPRKAMADRVPLMTPRLSSLMGTLALLLAALLSADAAVLRAGSGSDPTATGGVVFLFAVVVLVVASRAVHGRPAMIRLLLVVALIELVERAFTPIALHITQPESLGLHYAAALVALGLAITCAAALRSSRKRPA